MRENRHGRSRCAFPSLGSGCGYRYIWIMDPSVCVTVTLESGEHTLSASEMPKGAITLRITFER